MSTAEERAADPFRWCVYCDADCSESDPEHAPDCPSNTGVFPVREKDLTCAGCGGPSAMGCTRCNHQFEVGDRYMHIEIEPGDPLDPGLGGASISEVVCMDCAWAADAASRAKGGPA